MKRLQGPFLALLTACHTRPYWATSKTTAAAFEGKQENEGIVKIMRGKCGRAAVTPALMLFAGFLFLVIYMVFFFASPDTSHSSGPQGTPGSKDRRSWQWQLFVDGV